MDTDRTSTGVGAASAGSSGRPGQAGRALTAGLRIAGAGLLIAAAAIHLDLYLTGYRSIPVIGGLFLLQVITGFLVGAAVPVTGSRQAAASAAVFALATLGDYLLSVCAGLRRGLRAVLAAGDRPARGRAWNSRHAGTITRPSSRPRCRACAPACSAQTA